MIPQRKRDPDTLQAKASEDKALRVGVHFLERHQIKEKVPDGVVTLIGADGQAVRVDKNILAKSSTISEYVREAEGN